MPAQQKSLTPGAESVSIWDGSPQTKYEWFQSLEHALVAKEVTFSTLWQSGYVVDRTRVLVSSDEHAKHLTIANIQRRPFNDPTQLYAVNLVDDTKDVNAVTIDTARYTVAPEMLDAKDRSLFAAITDTINNIKRRDDYRKKSNGSGVKLIKILIDEINAASVEISQWAARRLAEVVAAGLTSPTTVAFDLFRKSYEEANAQLPPTRRNHESVIADTYVSVTRQLGESLGTRLDMELTLARIAKGKPNMLSLDETVQSILSVLSDAELRQTGHALKFGKPSKDSKPVPFVWTEGRHETCSICQGKHGGGRHLRRDCPDKPSDPVKKARTEKSGAREANSGKGAVKRAARSDAASDEGSDLQWEDDAPLAALFSDESTEGDNTHHGSDTFTRELLLS